MRLIDADDVMRMLTSVELNNGTITDAKIELRNVKTAYDIEKVVAELEELKDTDTREVYLTKHIRCDEAIDIVKRGGVE